MQLDAHVCLPEALAFMTFTCQESARRQGVAVLGLCLEGRWHLGGVMEASMGRCGLFGGSGA